MGAADSRTITWLLSVVAGTGLALLAGCSSAGRMLVAGDPRTARPAEHQAFDLMPEASTRNPGARPAVPRAIEVSGALHASPDGKWIAFESDHDGVHGVWVARPDGERARRVSGGRVALLPRWSPDGTRLMFLARESKRADAWNIWIADPEGPAPRKLTSGASVSLAGAAWFPDSRHICYGSNDWLVVVDTTSNTARAFRLPDHSSRVVGAPAVSPDGRRIVFAVAGEGAWMASLADGTVAQIATERDVDAFAWAPGGRQIAFRNARDGQWKVRIIK